MRDLKSKKYREAFVDAMTRNGLAFQIRELRQKAQLSQKELGDRMSKKQNVISRLEDPSYGSYTLRTLLELASAFDVALDVRFVSFGDFLKQSQRKAPSDLRVPSYAEESRSRPAYAPPGVVPDLDTLQRESVTATWISISSPAVGSFLTSATTGPTDRVRESSGTGSTQCIESNSESRYVN